MARAWVGRRLFLGVAPVVTHTNDNQGRGQPNSRGLNTHLCKCIRLTSSSMRGGALRLIQSRCPCIAIAACMHAYTALTCHPLVHARVTAQRCGRHGYRACGLGGRPAASNQQGQGGQAVLLTVIRMHACRYNALRAAGYVVHQSGRGHHASMLALGALSH